MKEVSDESVEQVLMMFKCHLDVGYTDTEANVMRDYHLTHLPGPSRRRPDSAPKVRTGSSGPYRPGCSTDT
ncbi:hypothetical protein G7085_19545 [Tessaracoccus sp. HDW20]|uniref:hypothetical protein n=1 Tax=Tessaracoccus coleopterorum TaxID=2714950 RepID=UPI0018D36200|nr:hypothetical protein [Tessaracoccus coleopterorum]NHB85993.1 hypothetical protein [Tessaracoccus coleopterorum]